MNSESRPRVSLGDAVGPLNTTPSRLINIDSEDPLLLFTPERSPAGRTFELASARGPVLEVGYEREPWVEARPSSHGVGGSVVVAFLVLGVLIGFAGGYTSGLFDDEPPAVAPPKAIPARADEPASLSAASVGADTTKQAWEQVPVGTQSKGPVAVERDSETAPNPTATVQRSRTARPVASAVATRGFIDVVSRPSGAEVALDGRVVGKTPLSIPDVTEGTHVVGIELAGFNRWATSVHVNRGERARVGASLAP